MTQLLAYSALMLAALLLTLAQYWYTFGLWPKNWWTFFGIGFAQILLMLMREGVEKERKK